MGVEIKRVMEKDAKGVDRQIYPVTHVNAVEGLSENGALEAPVKSVNGKVGNVVLTSFDLGVTESGAPIASETQDGMITAEMYRKLKQLLEAPPGSGGISLEKVEK